VSWAVAFVLWVRALLAYIKCSRENEQTQRECRQCISELKESLRLRLQSQRGSLGNFRNANFEHGSGKLMIMDCSGAIQKPDDLSWRARWIKKPLLFFLGGCGVGHFLRRFHKRDGPNELSD